MEKKILVQTVFQIVIVIILLLAILVVNTINQSNIPKSGITVYNCGLEVVEDCFYIPEIENEYVLYPGGIVRGSLVSFYFGGLNESYTYYIYEQRERLWKIDNESKFVFHQNINQETHFLFRRLVEDTNAKNTTYFHIVDLFILYIIKR